ncbi:MAG: TonB family protein [Steroidobacteraceae bacterium]
MAYGRTRRGGSFFAGRGAVLVAIIALHAVALVAFMKAGIRHRVEQPAEAVEVVFLEERQMAQPPAPQPTKLADVRPVDVIAPVFDLPADAPAPTAITVSPPKPQVAAAAPPSASDTPVSVDAVDYLKPLAVRYPPSARLARVQGSVMVRVLIGLDGRPVDVQIHKSSGSAQLDAAAREAVLAAVFRPFRVNGEARMAQAFIPIDFAMKMRTARRDDDRGPPRDGPPHDGRRDRPGDFGDDREHTHRVGRRVGE